MAHNFVAKRFAGFGSYLTRTPRTAVLTFVFGVLVTFVFCFGVYVQNNNESFDDLWMRQGDRLRDDVKAYNAYFGGPPRQHTTVLRRGDGSMFSSQVSFDTMKSVMTPIFTGALTFNSYLGATGNTPITYNAQSFCETPQVPSTFQFLGVTNVAYTYRQLTICLFPSRALPFGWGITNFPCRRYSALDCFREGGFDYPTSLQQLDAVAHDVASSPQLSSCLGQLQANLTLIFNSTTKAAELMSETTTAVKLFDNWGYSYRSTYTGKTSSQLANYLWSLIGTESLNGQTCRSSGQPCCLTWDGAKIPRNMIFSDDFVHARTTWYDYNENSPVYAQIRPLSGASDRLQLSLSWEQTVIDYFFPMYLAVTGSGFEATGSFGAHQLFFGVQRSADDQVSSATRPQIYIIAVGYTIVLAYSCLLLSKWSIPYTAANAVYSRLMLAAAGVFTVMFGTISAFGFAAIVGVTYNYLIVNVVPMLSLLFGMHNIFILVSTALSFASEQNVVKRMKSTWSVAGPSIMLKTLICIAVFLISAEYPVPLVRQLCWMLAICEFVNYWCLLFIYAPLLSLDMLRSEERRTDCCVPPCVTLGGPDFSPVHEEFQYLHKGNILGRYIRKYEHLVHHTAFKVLVVTFFLAFLVVFSIMGWTRSIAAQARTDTAALTQPSSYYRDFLSEEDIAFQGYQSLAVTVGTNIPSQQAAIVNLLTALGGSAYNSNSSLDRAWLANGPASFVSTQGSVSASAFGTAFQNWMQTSQFGLLYLNQIACQYISTQLPVLCSSFNPSVHQVVASQIPVFNTQAKSVKDILNTIDNNRNYADQSSSGSFVYGGIYRYYDTFLSAFGDVYAAVGWCVLATFILCLLFQFQIVATLVTMFVIITGLMEMWGLCTFIGAHANPFTVVNMCYEVGLLAAFSVHLVHIFQIKRGDIDSYFESRYERVTGALEEVLSGSVHMYATGFLAVLVMSASQVPFVNTYYWGMFAMMQFVALINGMILLPVLLSFVGPAPLYGTSAIPADVHLETESLRNIHADDAGSNMP